MRDKNEIGKRSGEADRDHNISQFSRGLCFRGLSFRGLCLRGLRSVFSRSEVSRHPVWTGSKGRTLA